MSAVLYRYELIITDDNTGAKINTFTWGYRYRDAYLRVCEQFESNPDVWGDCSFEIDPVPTSYVLSDAP